MSDEFNKTSKETFVVVNVTEGELTLESEEAIEAYHKDLESGRLWLVLSELYNNRATGFKNMTDMAKILNTSMEMLGAQLQGLSSVAYQQTTPKSILDGFPQGESAGFVEPAQNDLILAEPVEEVFIEPKQMKQSKKKGSALFGRRRR